MPSWIDILTGKNANIVLFRMWEDMEPCMKEDWAEISINEMKGAEQTLGYRLIPESILDGKSNPTFLLLIINNKGGSPIFGRVLDLARRATTEELDAFFCQLSPKCPLMATYIAKQRIKSHVLVPFQDSANQGKMACYL